MNAPTDLIQKHWFLPCLAAAVLSGFFFWSRIVPVADSERFRNVMVATVLFVMALPLELRTISLAVRRPLAIVLAVAITFGLLPLFCWMLSHLLNPHFSVGLMVVAATPCTLASAAVWTRRANGNEAIAILVTILTNLGCFVISPFWLLLTTDQVVTVGTASDMIAQLGLLVVIPIIVAQLFRLYFPVAQWANSRKTALGACSQLGVLMMVVLGSANAGRELSKLEGNSNWSLAEFLVMLATVALVHALMLGAGHQLGWLCRLERADRIAVGFAGSQKTLVVGLHLAVTYYGGLAILPMVTYHIFQLLLDVVVADRLREKGGNWSD